MRTLVRTSIGKQLPKRWLIHPKAEDDGEDADSALGDDEYVMSLPIMVLSNDRTVQLSGPA